MRGTTEPSRWPPSGTCVCPCARADPPGFGRPGGYMTLGGQNPCSVGALACPQAVNRLDDARLSRLGLLGVLDPAHPLLAVRVRQPVEEPPRRTVGAERLGEIVRHRHIAWRRVELDVDVDLVPGRNPGRLAVLGAERQQELPGPRRDGGAVRVPADRDPDGRLPTRVERRDHVVRHDHAGCRLAAEDHRRVEPHGHTSSIASAMESRTRPGRYGYCSMSAGVVDPLSTRIVSRPASMPATMSVSMRSPTITVVSEWAAIRFSALRNIIGFGLPTK